MSGFTSQYLSTRLDLFSGRLIDYPQLVAFIDQDLERIVAEIRAITGNHYDLDGGGANDIESRLIRGALEDFRVLVRPFSGSERRYLLFAVRLFELANLKVLIRGKFSAVDSAEIRRQLVDLGDFADLPLSRLIETDDPHEMLRLLETTAYAGIVRQARRVYEEQGHDLFLLDATIDLPPGEQGEARNSNRDELLLLEIHGVEKSLTQRRVRQCLFHLPIAAACINRRQ